MSLLDDNYFTERYGTKLAGFSNIDSFVSSGDFYEPFRFGEAFKGKNASAQVDTLERLAIDPSLLPIGGKLKWILRQFCSSTSAHGIPWISISRSVVLKILWLSLFLICFSMYCWQMSNVVKKYNRGEKMVDIELKFETAPFPAITICNMNPYKASKRGQSALYARTMNAFDKAMEDQTPDPILHPDDRQITKRNLDEAEVYENLQFEPAYSICQCDERNYESGVNVHACEANPTIWPKDKPPGTSVCICTFDRISNDAFPCYKVNDWAHRYCTDCSTEEEIGTCPKSKSTEVKTEGSVDCFCPMNAEHAKSCSVISGRVVKLWQLFGGQTPTEDPIFLEAMGFESLTDELAIVVKAKENMMFAASGMAISTRKKMVYKKEELILKCSFNGKQCDIKRDFYQHLDPSFGACYTYNFNRSRTLSAVRAGPMYGLRMLAYVNTTEYLPTTEAAGVRITIHSKDEFPFPDTFGYSAPVGYISSFGIRMRKMERLPPPAGDCLLHPKVDDYIYRGYAYTTQGCYRSCFQNDVMRVCHCGDPRFPVMGKTKHCEASDPISRRCLQSRTEKMGGLHGFSCNCGQPCQQSTFAVSYSASKWPSPSLKFEMDTCVNMNSTSCITDYKENGAMIEVFYEQLTYEVLTESQAYGMVNLLSDFGGQLGLWLGASVITCFEFIALFWDILFLLCKTHISEFKEKKRQAKERKS